MPIRILAPDVASQIAAGEVVERPASVVKELVENALDAGASFISITVEEAGRRLIEVSDNGGGIPADELPLAVERHATSKLQTADELFKIGSLGFRGEALASIASVSRLTITSRTEASAQGMQLRVDAGHASPIKPVGAPVGTLVRVEDLFYNVPARKKFLKKDVTERRHIIQSVTRYALAYPQVRFHLRQEGRVILQTSGNGERREALGILFDAEIARQMLEVVYNSETLSLSGFISPTSLTRASRQGITFFVNGRPVQDASLISALLKAYHTLLMVGRYPLAVLFLDVPPESVDVNVHPAKAEVRFREPDTIFTGVRNALRRALLAHSPVPEMGEQLRWQPEQSWQPPNQPAWQTPVHPSSAPSGTDWDPFDSRRWDEKTPAAPSDPTTGAVSSQQARLPSERLPLLRPVGQVASAFLVAEGPDGLYLIDQHAAHERVLFEHYMAQRGEKIPSQALLQPQAVELSPTNGRLLEEQLPTLSALGFEVETFGPHTFLVRAIPALLTNLDPGAALRVLVEDFEEDESPLQAELEARIVARICKRAAVKAGQTMSPDEQRALLLDLESCQSPRTCPHGRPTMIHLSVDLLERQFGRRGAR